MRKRLTTFVLAVLAAGVLSACAGGGGSAVYRHHYGYGGWWGYGPYIDRRPIRPVIVLPPPDDAVNLPVYPDPGPPQFEAVPLPAEPMPDMGMPQTMDLAL